MNFTVLTKKYVEPPFDEREILRYAACKSTDGATANLLRSCMEELKGKLSYSVCYAVFPLSVSGDVCDFKAFKTKSQNLADVLSDCNEAVVFASTVGVEIDRLIAKYTVISPSRALIFQAIGAERIESLCDAFCNDLSKTYKVADRFSPGYGDLPLDMQRDIFGVLNCEKKIGLFLNDSLLMSPSKSVTAIVGISGEKDKQAVAMGGGENERALSADKSVSCLSCAHTADNKIKGNKCRACKNESCVFRRDE